MKKRIISLVLVIVLVLSGCGYSKADLEAARSEAYESGYFQGIEDGGGFYKESDLEDAYYDGYVDGLFAAEYESSSIGSTDVGDVLSAADSFAYSKTDYPVYESWNDIMIYLDGYDPDGYPIPTYEEFLTCVETLMYYCMYLDEPSLFDNSSMGEYDPFAG